MLIEHEFISTMEQSDALLRAGEILLKLGFVPDPPGVNSVSYRRGVKRAPRAKRSDQLPQRVSVHFDRGRVQVAASLEESRQIKSETPMQKELLISLANLLESVLGRGESLESARLQWDNVAGTIERTYRRRVRNHRIWGAILVIFIAGIIGALVALR